jgi:DinB family protein/ChrR-like protein with cupin domain
MATADDVNHPLPWSETLDRLRDFPTRLLKAIHGIPERDLERSESEKRWSILNVIAHLGDHELVSAARIRATAAGEHPRLIGYNQERLVASHRDKLADLLEHFSFLRRMNLHAVEGRLDEELALTAESVDQGELTVRHLVARVQRHQEKHLRQIEKIKTTLGLRGSDTLDVSGVVASHPDSVKARNYAPGIRIRELWRSGVKRAIQVEIDAGAVWPGLDYHVPGPEEVYVVSGDFNDGMRTYESGSFLHHPAGSSHVPQSRGGCTLFVFHPEG